MGRIIKVFVIPIIAVFGVIFGVVMVHRGMRKVMPAQPIVAPPKIPFAYYVAGSGIIEALHDNIAIGVQSAAIVEKIYVKVGDRIQKGDLLFHMDVSVFKASLKKAKKQKATFEGKLYEAQIQLKKRENDYALLQKITDKRAVSQKELDDARFNVLLAKAAVKTAISQVKLADAQIDEVKKQINERYVYSPIDGEVLQIETDVGQFPNSLESFDKPPMIIGSLKKFQVRVDVDEYDTTRIRPKGKAIAYLRGNPNVKIPLDFAYLEPLVVPKTNLSGLVTERTDTRVLQLIYTFCPPTDQIYVGQQLDVYLEAKEDVDAVE